MSSALDGLFHDAANLRRFVEYTNRVCREESQHESYLGGTETFFKHTANLAAVTIEYLDALPRQSYKTPLRIRAERQKLVALKAYWRLVHRFIKPAADANTLKIPIPLVNFLSDLSQGIPHVPPPKVLILITQELNYFQYRHTGLKGAYGQLQGVVPKAPNFPEGLGFVGIPYSQGSSLFTNLVIFHELGHFVFEETATANSLLAHAFCASLTRKGSPDLQLSRSFRAKQEFGLEHLVGAAVNH